MSADDPVAAMLAKRKARIGANVTSDVGMFSEFAKGTGVGVQGLKIDSMKAIGATVAATTGDYSLLDGAIAASNALPQPDVGTYADVEGLGDFANYLAFQIGGSLPEMGTVAGVTVGAGATTTPIGGVVAGVATSSFFNGGRLAARQREETGEINPVSAITGGVLMGALDYIVPGDAGKLASKIAGEVSKRGVKVAAGQVVKSTAVEGITETTQQLMEQGFSDPENLRILLDPKTSEEKIKSEALLAELVDSAIGGAGAGGVFETTRQGVGAVVDKAKGTGTSPRAEERAEARADAAEMDATQPTNPDPEKRPQSTVEIAYDMGPNRPNRPNDAVLDIAAKSVEEVLGAGSRVVVTSGTEGADLPQFGSPRHKTGNAADIAIYTPGGRKININDDPEIFERLALSFARNGVTGMGFGSEYMGGDHFHIDTVGTSEGGSHVWASGAKAMGDTLVPIMQGSPNAPAGSTVDGPSANYYDRMIGLESSGDPNAENPLSTASGLGQFTDGTWLATIKRNRPDLAEGKTDPQLLALKKDRVLGRQLLVYFTEANADLLRRAQIPVNDTSLALMHRFGESGGITVLNALRSDPTTPISAVVTPGAMAANPDLAGQTVGGIYDWYASRLGTDFTATGGVSSEEARATVKTEDDRKGTPLTEAPQAIQRDAITAQIERVFGKVVEASEMPPQMRGQVYAKLMPNNIDPRFRPVDNLARIANGTSTIDGLTATESMSLAQQTLRDFGYTPETIGGVAEDGTVTPAKKPNFFEDVYDPVAGPLSAVITRQMNPATATGTLLRSPLGQDFVPTALNQIASAVTRSAAIKDANYAAAKAAGVPKSRLPRVATTVDKANAKQIAEMATLVSDLARADVKVAKPLTIRQRQILRLGLQALTRVDQKAATSVEQMLRQYKTPNLASAKGVSKAAADLEARLAFIVDDTKLQVDPSRRTRSGYAKSPLRTVASRTKMTEERSIASRGLVSEAKAENLAQKQAASLREEMRQEAARVEFVNQMRETNNAAIDAFAKTLKDPTSFGATGKSVTGALLAPNPLAKPRGAKGSTGDMSWRMRIVQIPFMTPRQINDTFKHMLPKVTFNRSSVSFIEGVRRAQQEGDAEANAVIRAGETLVQRIEAWGGKRRIFQGKAGYEKQVALAEVMAEMTIYEATLFHPPARNKDGSISAVQPTPSLYTDETDFEDSFAKDDGNGQPGVNAHIPEERHDAVKEAFKRFLTLDQAGRDLYREVALFHKNSHDRARNAMLVNVLNTPEMLGQNSPVRSIEDYLKNRDKFPKPVQELARSVLVSSKLKGDYFPLAHGDGKFQVFAKKTMTATGRNEAEAMQKMKAMMREDPRIASGASGIIIEGTGTNYVAKTEMAFYFRHHTMKAAEAQAVELKKNGFKRRDGGTVHFDMIGDPAVVREQTNSANLPAEFREQIVTALKDVPPAAKDAIFELLNKRQAINVLNLSRENVLGESTSLASNLRNSLVRTGMQLSVLTSQPEVDRILAQTENTVRMWRDTSQSIEKANVSRRVIDHVHKLNGQRAASYDALGSIQSAVSRFGTGAGVVWFLSSISYYALNATQPALLGVPYLSGRYGAKGGVELMTLNAKALKYSARGMMAAPKALVSRADASGKYGSTDYIKTAIMSDPKNPGVPLNGQQSTTFDPVTGKPVILLNTQLEYDQYSRGEINLQFLRFLSENRLRGTLGSAIHENGDAINQLDNPDSIYGKPGEVLTTIGRGMLHAVGFLAEHIEYTNRRAVAEAVYNLERKERGLMGKALTETQLQEIADAADEMNSSINFDMSTANRSQVQNAAGPLLLFSSYGWNLMYGTWQGMKAMANIGQENRSTEERRALAGAFVGIVGGHFLIAGVQAGIPQWAQATGSLALWLGDAIVDLMQDVFGVDDDEEDELDKMRTLGFWDYSQGWVRENLGDTTADLLFNGAVATGMGVDLQSRISLGEGYTFVDAGIPTDKEQLQQIAFDLLGPLGGLAQALVDGVDQVRTEGASTRLIVEKFAPIKLARDLARASRFGEEGARTRSGNVRLEPDAIGYFDGTLAQALGFTPIEVAKMYKKVNLEYEMGEKMRGQREAILTRFRRLDIENTRESRAELRKMVREFNKANPGDAISYETLKRAQKTSAEDEAAYARTGGLKDQNPRITAEINRIIGE